MDSYQIRIAIFQTVLRIRSDPGILAGSGPGLNTRIWDPDPKHWFKYPRTVNLLGQFVRDTSLGEKKEKKSLILIDTKFG